MLQRITLIFLALALSACASNRQQVRQESAGFFAIYGNWCGPDHPKSIDPPPEALDQLDAACMRHDYCYVQKGYLNCDCDKVLVTELKHDIVSGFYDTEQRRYASSFANFFQASPCEQAKSTSASEAPKDGVVKKVFNTTKAGLSKFIDLVGGDTAPPSPPPEKKGSDSTVGGGAITQQPISGQEVTNGDVKSPLTAQPLGTQPKVWY